MKTNNKKSRVAGPATDTDSDRIQIVIRDDSRGSERPLRTVTYGSVTVTAPAPAEEDIQANVKAGQKALARGLKALLKPGVKLDLPPHIPRYHASSEHPDCIVRVLDGNETVGRFVDGKFKAIKN